MSEAEFKPPEEWAVVRPGEILVLRYDSDLTAEEAWAIRRRLDEWLPGVKTAVVAADKITVELPGEAS
jgi:hypothetical protein